MNLMRCQQEEYRGRGLAKAVASKLFRENVKDFSQDGLAHADVGFENVQSQGVCRSLKGIVGWSVYCKLLRNPVRFLIIMQAQGHGLPYHSRIYVMFLTTKLDQNT